MRNMLCIALLVPVLVLAGNLQPVTTVVRDNEAVTTAPAAPTSTKTAPAPRAKGFTLGTVDTVGGTKYDWAANGPSYRWIVNSPDFGLHVGWMFSNEDASPWSDRNQRYNFYDYTTGAWNWIDPDFMASGVNAYTARSGFGNLDADPSSGVALFSTHNGSPIRPEIARDMAPGAGIFEYCSGSPNAEGYLWPPISLDANSKIHCALIDDATRNCVFYANVDPWCTWSSPVGLASPQPDPEFPDHNIAVSKVSQKVFVTWVYTGVEDEPGYYRMSTDGGQTWSEPTELPDPPAFTQPDTQPSFYITSLFPWYDYNDRLHIVADVTPVVRDTHWIIPAEIWHYCPDNTPNWSRVHRAECNPENLQAGVGYNAAYACRPTIGSSSDGRLFVAWEQFDSANVEPVTNLLRADIFVAGSNDGGLTWSEAKKITDGGECSHRFPCIVDRAIERNGTKKIAVFYMVDSVAGSIVQGQGPATRCPMCVQWIDCDSIVPPGVAEGRSTVPTRIELAAKPNPFSSRTLLNYTVPRSGKVSLVLCDATGRPLQTLVNGSQEQGRYAVSMNGSDLAAGVYFCKLTVGKTSLTKRLTLVR
ncbi:MAG: T9SS type A sorting domain-containing protein [candidate division WOR-3 bacterium]